MRSALLVVTSGCVTALTVTQPSQKTDIAAPITLVAQDGHTVTLDREPTVVVFYRGFW